jgi:hypothetical protein
MRRSGQVSSFLKPILVILFATLFVTVIITFLDFELNLREQEQDIQFQQNSFQNFEKISDCLEVKDKISPGIVLNKSKIEIFERNVKNKQLPCASIYNEAYNVTVEQEYLQGRKETVSGSGRDIALVLDRSTSMNGAKLDKLKSAARDFVTGLSGDVRIAAVSFGGGTVVESYFTTNHQTIGQLIEGLSAGGGTPLRSSINTASSLNWNEGDDGKGMIVLSDGGSTDGNPGPAGEKAAESGIEVHGIMYGEGAKASQTEDYTGAEECLKQDSENSDGDSCWWAAETAEELNQVYDSIEDSISSSTTYGGGGNTCSLPAVEEYDGKVDLVFAADASLTYESEWTTICNSVVESVEEMENKGLDASVSIYAPSNPGDPRNGLAQPMNLSSGEEYDYRSTSRKVPSCMDKDFNDAENNGITEWNGKGIFDYKTGRDSGLEAWGVFSKWIMENHEWREDTDIRKTYIFGDHLPSGGSHRSDEWEDSYASGRTTPIGNETDLVENVSDIALQKNVEFHTFKGDSWEYERVQEKKPFDKNDAAILMEELAGDTGGSFEQYSESSQITSSVIDSLRSLEKTGEERNFCGPNSYSFGQSYNPPDNTLSNKRQISYPVAVKSAEETSPGRITLEERVGEFSRLTGNVKRIIERGKESGNNISTTISTSLSSKFETTNSYEVTRPVESTYGLENSETGDKIVQFKDKLTIGVNGDEMVSKNASSGLGEIDFTSGENQFKAYKGASLQHIATNSEAESGMFLDPIQLVCISCNPEKTQLLTEQGIDVAEDDDEYEERGGIGAFEYNSTKVNIGEDEETSESALCIGSREDRVCNVLNVENIDPLELSTGSYILRLTYIPSENKVVISD